MTSPQISEQIERFLAPFDHIQIDTARLDRGMCVVDLGCGTGSTAELAAQAIGHGGHVHVVDIDSEAVLHTQRRLARLDCEVSTAVTDLNATVPSGPWDRVLSRFVLMLVSDPVTLLRKARAQLAPNGSAVFMVWGPADDNPWHMVPAKVLAPNAEPAHLHRPFALGHPDRLLDIAHQGGFRTAHVTAHTPLLPVAESLDAAVSLALADMRTTPRPDVVAQLTSALRPYLTHEGRVEMPSSALVLTATD